MSQISVFRHHSSGVLSLAAVEPTEVVTSEWIDEQLAETYARNGLKAGLLSGLAGIEERRWWAPDVGFADVAAMAGEKAIAAAGIDRAEIGLMISTSVCKDHLEPSMACAIHNRLGLGADCLNFDIGNACLGFVNAMHMAATMLDAGMIRYALIVDGEGSRYTQQTTLDRLRRPETTAGDVFSEFASLTLGSGGAAMVMTRMDLHPEAHALIGGVGKAATEHNTLCVGDLDKMTTDTHGLLVAGLDLAEQAWTASAEIFDWAGQVDWFIIHQVSKVHTTLLCDRLGIDATKVPLTFPYLGNVGPAAVPMTLASVQDQITAGQRVLCMGIGSGLNTSFTEIQW
jgi:3-oxoacyl-[acyl-carrier-protein] synthase III